MIKIPGKMEYVEANIVSILSVFPMVDLVSLKQYLTHLGVVSSNRHLTKYVKHCVDSGSVIQGWQDGVPYLKRNVAVKYDNACLNAFSMLVALSEYAGVDDPTFPIPAVRSNFPYDYIFATPNTIFTIINFDGRGKEKIIAHNYMDPNLYKDESTRQVLVITASDGYANQKIEELPIRGEAMIARIERTPHRVSRNVSLING